MAKGKIIKFHAERGFGFIAPENGGRDVYFHKSKVKDRGYELEVNAPVEYEAQPGKEGKPEATHVRILGYAPESPNQSCEPSSSLYSTRLQSRSLPSECKFHSFYTDDGNLDLRIFFDAAQKAADLFQKSGLKSTQFRQLYQGFLSFAGPMRDNRLNFPVAKERFGAFYVERVVRQTERKVLPPVVKELIDAHRELALSDPRQMLALFRYIKNIYCYFSEPVT